MSAECLTNDRRFLVHTVNRTTSTAWNEPSQLSDLVARFPYMFAEPNRKRAYLFFRGWLPTFASMCVQIDSILGEDKRDFVWTRIREKFGAPSLSYMMRGQARHVIHAHRPTEVRRITCSSSEIFEPSAVAIQDAVLLAELALRGECIVCGMPSIITNAGGPWASLCAEHRSSAFLDNLEGTSLWVAAELFED